MYDCPFILIDGLWQCPDCGWVYPKKSKDPPHRNCPATQNTVAKCRDEFNRLLESRDYIVGGDYSIAAKAGAIASAEAARQALKEAIKQAAEQERQQTEAVELGKSLGWTIEDAKHWAAALLQWKKAGRPARTDEEIDEAMEFCEEDGIRPCEKHKNGKCTCGGCSAIMRKMPIRQAARMGTVGCPAMRW